VFRHDRQIFVVTRAHEEFYRKDLRGVEDSRLIAQPRNRGTGVAMTLSLLRILQRGPDRVVILDLGIVYAIVDRMWVRLVIESDP